MERLVVAHHAPTMRPVPKCARASIRLRVAFMSAGPAAQGGRQRPGPRRAARRGQSAAPAHSAIAASRLNGSCGAQRTLEVSGAEPSRISAALGKPMKVAQAR